MEYQIFFCFAKNGKDMNIDAVAVKCKDSLPESMGLGSADFAYPIDLPLFEKLNTAFENDDINNYADIVGKHVEEKFKWCNYSDLILKTIESGVFTVKQRPPKSAYIEGESNFLSRGELEKLEKKISYEENASFSILFTGVSGPILGFSDFPEILNNVKEDATKSQETTSPSEKPRP